MKYVGWDWASQTHDVTVLDDTGAMLDRWAFAHTASGWAATIHRLHGQGEPDDLPVIIERTSGLVVDRLLEAGHPVVPVHPTSFHAARPRWGASGAVFSAVTATNALSWSAAGAARSRTRRPSRRLRCATCWEQSPSHRSCCSSLPWRPAGPTSALAVRRFPPCTRISATPRHGARRGHQGVAATRPARHLRWRRASWTTLAAWHHESIYP